MGKLQWPGDENKNQETRFRFKCNNIECEKGRAKFHAVYEEPGPAFVPSGMDCPFCADGYAEWCMDGLGSVIVRGQAGGVNNPHYSPKLAEAEHKWMEMQIDEAKDAVNAEDQVTGKAASPYKRRVLNHEKAVELGIAKKRSAEDAEKRNRIMDERSRDFAAQNIDNLSEIEKKHAGRRSDG